MIKVDPLPYRKLENPSDVLDKILNFFNDNSEREGIEEIRHKFKLNKHRVSDKDLQIAMNKLLEDGMLSAVAAKKNGIETDDNYFLITYRGQLFLQKFPLFFLKRRPYRKQQFMEGIRFSYGLLKFFATIFYSLALGVIAYWSVQVSDKSEKLERLVESDRASVSSPENRTV